MKKPRRCVNTPGHDRLSGVDVLDGSALFGDVRLPERFWSKVLVDEGTGCWLWTASVQPSGYGQLWWRPLGRPDTAHAIAYRELVGPLPFGTPQLDHLCRVRRCCNPAHLEPVTSRENVLRGVSLSAQRARQTECSKGHPLSGDNLVMRAGHRRCRQCEYDDQRERNGTTVVGNGRKTHCAKGHEYTPENTYRDPKRGWRQCRSCIAERKR